MEQGGLGHEYHYNDADRLVTGRALERVTDDLTVAQETDAPRSHEAPYAALDAAVATYYGGDRKRAAADAELLANLLEKKGAYLGAEAIRAYLKGSLSVH